MGKASGIHKGEARQSGPQPARGNVSRDLILSASTQALIYDKAAEMVDVHI